jgi:hypothetical protein
MKVRCLIVLLLAIFTAAVSAQDTEKRADIRRLLELTGSAELGIDIMEQMIGNYKMSFPDVPSDFWDNFMEEVSPDDLIDLIIPIYDRYLTHREIRNIIAFYETPTGKKLIRVLPLIQQDSYDAGTAWGLEISNRVIEKLKQKGYR